MNSAAPSNTVSGQTDTGRARLAPVVLQVLPSLETGGGGVERATIDIAAAIKANGAQAFVASSGGHLVNELDRCGATHITLPLASKNPLVMRRNVQRLVEIIELHRINIVHARSRAPAWSARAAARRTGCSFLTTFHGTYNYGAGITGAWKKRYNAVMADGDLVIANSNFIAEHLRSRYNVPDERIRVVPRGVDLNVFDPTRTSVARVVDLATKWNLREDATIVMLPGRLTRWKGQSLLIEALGILKQQMGADRFNVIGLLVGSDQGRSVYRGELEQQIKSLGLEGQVQVLGHCPDMAAAYMLTDVVVSASTDPEAFGRIVAEAQAMGRPVVVADHGGTAEQVLAGETGWRFPPGDAPALAGALAEALAIDKDARAQLADKAIRHVHSRYSKTGMCTATLDIYAELRQRRAI
ncbi:MAG: glycosyltransferase family 4 protein [Alphaproteobacteria bacterium]|nr:glycosyltransferase family 4 protein [Alphaproteobacteria bacterium]